MVELPVVGITTDGVVENSVIPLKIYKSYQTDLKIEW